MRLDVEVEEDDSVWLKDAAHAAKLSVAQFVRNTLKEARMATEERVAEEAAKPGKRESVEKKQARFLKALENIFHIGAACRLTKIDRKTVRAWRTDNAFEGLVTEAQEVYLERIEIELIKLGRGKLHKGLFQALIAFLNAHHPQYGRIKGELIARELGVMMGRFYEAVKELAGEDLADKVNEKVRALAERKLSEYTD